MNHLWLAFREFDIVNYYETYVFVFVIGGTMIWALATTLQTICTWNSAKRKENQALILLRNDLSKAGPYKKDKSGVPEQQSVIKLHAVIFKHAQKKIIDRELDYQDKRIKALQAKDMEKYKKFVRRADMEYRQIENYVRDKACALMNLDPYLYEYVFTKALQQPEMVERIKTSD